MCAEIGQLVDEPTFRPISHEIAPLSWRTGDANFSKFCCHPNFQPMLLESSE
jgi:hypothetical protein